MSTELSEHKIETSTSHQTNKDTVFTLKRWNLVAVWSWDVECDVCAICRTFLIGLSSIYVFKLKKNNLLISYH